MRSIFQRISRVKQSVNLLFFTSCDYKVAFPSTATVTHAVMWSFEVTRSRKKEDEWLLFRCLWHQYPSSEYIFLHPLGTQRLMEHESGIFLGVVRLSHAPVWRGAAGDACMRLRPTGHAGRVWANSGVNIEGSNWRTARQGISYISILCGSAYNILTFSGEDSLCMPKVFSDFLCSIPGAPLIHVSYIVHFFGHIFY